MFTEREFLISVIFRQRKVPVTSGMEAIDYVCQLIGYQQFHTICGGTHGNETKAKPTIRTYLHTMLTGDTLNRNAAKNVAIAIELENPAWVRSVHSSQ